MSPIPDDWPALDPTDGAADADVRLASLTPVVAEIARDIEPISPPPSVKVKLLAALDPPPGYTIRPASDAEFVPTSHPGVSMRMLHVDPVRKTFSCLLRFAPGGRLPGHPHAQPEECMVLDGTLRVGGVLMHAGDYQRVEAGVDHVDQWSDTGGTAFVTAPLDLLEH